MMTPSIAQLIADSACVALTLRRTLEPLEGRDVALFPPTYPAPKGKTVHSFGTPYTVNETRDGVRICDLDSVQSQANRMEAAFTRAFADVVPHHTVEAGGERRSLLELPHRIADAAIRATGLGAHIRHCFEAFEQGDPVALARIAPTSLVYGAWDSRDTRIRVPRAVRSEVRAHDVSVLTRSTQYTPAFAQAELGADTGVETARAKTGFAPVPAVDAPGGILVHGEIVHSASVSVHVLRRYRTADASEALPRYLLGLALAGLVHAMREGHLRSGCTLVPGGSVAWEVVRADGTREAVDIDAKALVAELRETARAWAAAAGVELGGAPTVHTLDPKTVSARVAAKAGR